MHEHSIDQPCSLLQHVTYANSFSCQGTVYYLHLSLLNTFLFLYCDVNDIEMFPVIIRVGVTSQYGTARNSFYYFQGLIDMIWYGYDTYPYHIVCYIDVMCLRESLSLFLHKQLPDVSLCAAALLIRTRQSEGGWLKAGAGVILQN